MIGADPHGDVTLLAAGDDRCQLLFQPVYPGLAAAGRACSAARVRITMVSFRRAARRVARPTSFYTNQMPAGCWKFRPFRADCAKIHNAPNVHYTIAHGRLRKPD